jgi:hypothetical protein
LAARTFFPITLRRRRTRGLCVSNDVYVERRQRDMRRAMAIRKLAPLRLLSTTAICQAVISMRGLTLVNSGLSRFDRLQQFTHHRFPVLARLK